MSKDKEINQIIIDQLSHDASSYLWTIQKETGKSKKKLSWKKIGTLTVLEVENKYKGLKNALGEVFGDGLYRCDLVDSNNESVEVPGHKLPTVIRVGDESDQEIDEEEEENLEESIRHYSQINAREDVRDREIAELKEQIQNLAQFMSNQHQQSQSQNQNNQQDSLLLTIMKMQEMSQQRSDDFLKIFTAQNQNKTNGMTDILQIMQIQQQESQRRSQETWEKTLALAGMAKPFLENILKKEEKKDPLDQILPRVIGSSVDAMAKMQEKVSSTLLKGSETSDEIKKIHAWNELFQNNIPPLVNSIVTAFRPGAEIPNPPQDNKQIEKVDPILTSIVNDIEIHYNNSKTPEEISSIISQKYTKNQVALLLENEKIASRIEQQGEPFTSIWNSLVDIYKDNK